MSINIIQREMRDFTFGVVTYNSDSTIIETLESIKYQIENFGNGIRFYLIISDDCSEDNTIFWVNQWIKINRSLFYETKVLITPVNGGVCANYAQLINSIQTDYFLQIAGDDLVCSRNIFKSVMDLGQNELRVYIPIIYNGEQVQISDSNIARQLYYKDYKHSNKRDIRLLETLTPYSTTGITFLRHHYTSGSMEFIKQYKNYEDDTSLYYILKNNSNVSFTFWMEPFVIYRRSGSSLTTSVDNANQIRFLDDLYSFRKLTLKNEQHLPTKIFLLMIVWDAFLMKHRFNASNSFARKIRKWINNRRIKRGKNSSCFNEQCNIIHLFLLKEEQYLKRLREDSEAFVKTMR